jgi:two-component system, chemotaxis family, chemotaxis protein CheY
MNALVIDDSRVVRSIFRHILGELGFRVHESTNGREGIEALNRMTAPDVVFVDWNMPIMNGLEFISAVRGDALRADLPLIMVTTESEMEAVGKAVEVGVSEYIMKPFDREIVREKLEMLGIGVG